MPKRNGNTDPHTDLHMDIQKSLLIMAKKPPNPNVHILINKQRVEYPMWYKKGTVMTITDTFMTWENLYYAK